MKKNIALRTPLTKRLTAKSQIYIPKDVAKSIGVNAGDIVVVTIGEHRDAVRITGGNKISISKVIRDVMGLKPFDVVQVEIEKLDTGEGNQISPKVEA
jgi:AbrB family looped-hinge helix DNA binding protein